VFPLIEDVAGLLGGTSIERTGETPGQTASKMGAYLQEMGAKACGTLPSRTTRGNLTRFRAVVAIDIRKHPGDVLRSQPLVLAC
jgi:hypothetical protein